MGSLARALRGTAIYREKPVDFLARENWSLIGGGRPTHLTSTPATVKSGATVGVSFAQRIQFNGSGQSKRFLFPFYTASGAIGEISLPNDVTIEAYWQASDQSTPKRILFGGQTSITRRWALELSDPIFSPYNDGDYGWLLIYVSVANSSLLIPGGWTGLSDPARENLGLGEGCAAGNVISGGIAAIGTASSNGKMYGCMGAVGYYPPGTKAPQSMFGQGDSHNDGSNDCSIQGRSECGEIMRLCLQQFAGDVDLTIAQRCPYVPMAKGGESGQEFLDNSSIVRRGMLDFVTDVYIQASNHDRENGDGITSWKAVVRNLIIWAAQGRRVRRIIAATPYPKATSTDYFATASNQTSIEPDVRGQLSSYMLDTGATGLKADIRPSFSNLLIINPASVFEVNSSNVLTQNGGLFKVGSLATPFATATIANSSNLNASGFRVTFTGSTPAVGRLKRCIGRMTSGTYNGNAFNVEYDTDISGTRRIVTSPAMGGTSAVGDTVEFYDVPADGVIQGPITEGGIHLLKNAKAAAGYYLNSVVPMEKSNIAVRGAAPVPIDFDPYALTSFFLFDARETATLFKDVTGLLPVTADGDPVLLMKGLNTGTARDLSDAVGGTYTLAGSQGSPCITFNGTTQRLRKAGALTDALAQPCWYLMVYKPISIINNQTYMSGNNGGTHRQKLSGLGTGTTMQMAAGGTNLGMTGNNNTNLKKHLIILNTPNGTSYINNGTAQTQAALGSQDQDGLTIAADSPTLITSPANMELYFMTAVSGVPSASQITNANLWMAANWP